MNSTEQGRASTIEPFCSKKPRFSYETALDLSDKPKPAKFLSFHFHVLRTLYSEEEEEEGSKIEASTWKQIETFLQKREQLVAAKKEAVCMQDIHAESRRYFMEFNSDNMSIQTTPRKHNHLPNPSPVFSHHHHLTSQASVSSVVHNDSKTEIITRLLGRRHKIVEQEFTAIGQERFEPLLITTEALLEQLRSKKTSAMFATSNNNQKHIQDLLAVNIYKERQPRTTATFLESETPEHRSKISNLGSKITLWSLLAQDLRQAIKITSSNSESTSA